MNPIGVTWYTPLRVTRQRTRRLHVISETRTNKDVRARSGRYDQVFRGTSGRLPAIKQGLSRQPVNQ